MAWKGFNFVSNIIYGLYYSLIVVYFKFSRTMEKSTAEHTTPHHTTPRQRRARKG
jgi:hypothetical protein